MINNKLKTVDLFAGIGGLRLGFEKAGFETVFSNDFDPYCAKTYNLNFKSSPMIVEDIRKIRSNDIPNFDVLLAGFPCQPFSVAGYRKGFEDSDRGNLFFDIIRILEAKKPRAILLENVKNLQTHDEGRTFRIIVQELERIGYHVKAQVLNTRIHGNLPHNRERIFIAGFLSREEHQRFQFPEPRELTVNIRELLDEEADDKYYYNGKNLYPQLKDHVTSRDTVYQWRRKYVRANKRGVCPTLTANMGMGGHNVPIIFNSRGIRKLTPRECIRLQGFPDSYKLPENLPDSRLYKQAGNSVSVPVIHRIAKNIKMALDPARNIIITDYAKDKIALRA